MGFDIEAWSDYGVAMVGAAAALTGLLFVAVSVNSAWFSSSASHRGRAGQALVLFAVPLVTGILLLIPGQTATALGIEIAAFGLVVGRALLALGGAKLSDEPRALVVIDRVSPRSLITLALIVCGASLIVGHFGGLYWLAGAHVGALLAGLLNAWVFLLVAGAHTEG
jgi:modulator of FtsH protease